MKVSIEEERADTDVVRALVDELEGELAAVYPDESRHGYDVAKLLARGVSFFVVRVDGEPVGCGGVQVEGDHAELKRMFVRPSHRGRGLSSALIAKLEEVARAAGARVLGLETGVHQHEALAHEHPHRHDDGHHQDHTHAPMPPGEHSHAHRHRPLRHAHPHVPDAHHGHRH